TSAAGTVTPALSASSTFGNLHVRLSGAQVGRLDLRSRGGRVEADLPRQLNAALSTEGGELDLRMPGGAAGDLRV
ncbi:MAG: hypothetical protein Q4C67_10735, partial [Deinococcus sp.]|nr:hypothetical protein [Deinococcus sp.]